MTESIKTLIELGYSKKDAEEIIKAYPLTNLKDETLKENIKTNYKLLMNLGYTNEEVIKVTQQNFAHTLILIALTCLIAIGAFAFYNLSTSISLALGFIAAVYTSQLFVPHLWAMAYRKRIKVKKENKEEIKE